MPAGVKITEELFTQIKTELEYIDPTTAAIKNHMSVKTILQIKGSADYKDYVAMREAQHPAAKSNQISQRELLEGIDHKLNRLLVIANDNKLF